MRRRVQVLAFTSASAMALVGSVSGTASAACWPSVTLTGGTGTIFMTRTYIANMKAHGIVMTPVNPISNSVVNPDPYTTTIWTVSGGDADLKHCTGTVQFPGGILVTKIATGQQLMLGDLRYNVANGSLDFTVQTPNGAIAIHAMDLAGTQSGEAKGHTGTYSASELFLDPAGAAALNSVFDTTAFLDKGVFGGFTTTFTTAERTSTAPHAQCG